MYMFSFLFFVLYCLGYLISKVTLGIVPSVILNKLTVIPEYSIWNWPLWLIAYFGIGTAMNVLLSVF